MVAYQAYEVVQIDLFALRRPFSMTFANTVHNKWKLIYHVPIRFWRIDQRLYASARRVRETQQDTVHKSPVAWHLIGSQAGSVSRVQINTHLKAVIYTRDDCESTVILFTVPFVILPMSGIMGVDRHSCNPTVVRCVRFHLHVRLWKWVGDVMVGESTN